jgi:hypothetical protein
VTADLVGTAPALVALLLAALTARRERRPAVLRVPVPASGRSRTGR